MFITAVCVLFLHPHGFPQKAEFRGGTLVTRVYIKESTYS